MSPPDIQIEVFGKTDVGLIREHNEDNLLIADLGGALRESELDAPATLKLGEHGALFLVCDGMGGAAAGEVAAQMAVDAIFDSLAACDPQPREAFARALRRAVETANERIFQQSRDNQNERGMGTTCTAAALNDDTLIVAQIGDSRCYVFRQGRLGQVTKDQSLAWQLIEAGAMTPEDAKAFEHANIILQALGVQDSVDVVLSQVTLRRGDIVVLCSDGLHGPVVDQEIQDVLVAESDLRKAGDGLLQKALERDGPDNITVVLARFNGTGLQPPTDDDKVVFTGYDPGRDPESDNAPSSTSDANSGATGGAVAGDAGVEQTDEIAPGGRRGAGRARAKATFANRFGPGARKGKRTAARDPDPNRRGFGIGRLAGGLREKWNDLGFSAPSGVGRSVIVLFFLAVLAAAAGGIVVLRCERDQAVRIEGTAP